MDDQLSKETAAYFQSNDQSHQNILAGQPGKATSTTLNRAGIHNVVLAQDQGGDDDGDGDGGGDGGDGGYSGGNDNDAGGDQQISPTGAIPDGATGSDGGVEATKTENITVTGVAPCNDVNGNSRCIWINTVPSPGVENIHVIANPTLATIRHAVEMQLADLLGSDIANSPSVDVTSYVDQIQNGGTMAAVRSAIAESQPEKQALGELIQNVQNRPIASSDTPWVNGQIQSLADGKTDLPTLYQGLAHFSGEYGVLNAAYHNFLSRDVDPSGLSTYENQLGSRSMTMLDVMNALAFSPESANFITSYGNAVGFNPTSQNIFEIQLQTDYQIRMVQEWSPQDTSPQTPEYTGNWTLTTATPLNSVTYTLWSGKQILKPANIDVQTIYNQGVADRNAILSKWGHNLTTTSPTDLYRAAKAAFSSEVGMTGKFDAQRQAQPGLLYSQYQYLSNYAVGVYCAGFGLTPQEMYAVAGIYAFKVHSNGFNSHNVSLWTEGWIQSTFGELKQIL